MADQSRREGCELRRRNEAGKMVKIILLVLFMVQNSKAYHNGYGYTLMPTLFHQDNYDECAYLKDRALYCSFKFTLEPVPNSNDTSLWNVIKEVSGDAYNYRHDILRHSICVPITCPKSKLLNDHQLLTNEINDCYNEKYASLELQGTVSDLECERNVEKKVDSVDLTLKFLFYFYIMTVLMASFLDQVLDTSASNSMFKELVTALSIKRNWYRLKTIKNTPDIERLKCIQAIRVYNMGLVMLTHMFMFMFMMPISNPRLIEELTGRFTTVFLASGPLSVSTFFMISAWLLIHGLLTAFEGRKEITFRSLLWVFLKRYMRLTPTLAVVIGFHATWLRHMGDGPNWDHYVGREFMHCRSNWWTNLLYVNNYINIGSMCLLTTWYMALDTQYFIILLLAIWAIKKYPKCVWYVISILMILHVVLTFVENYTYDFPALMIPLPESLYDFNHTLNNKQWHVQYVSFCGNMAGPLVGLSLGYFYYKNKERKLFRKKIHSVFWWLISHGFGYGMVIIPGVLSLSKQIPHDRFWSSLHAAFSRLIFSTGIGFALLGTTYGAGGVIKHILQWPPMYVFGRLTYSAYLVHVPLLLIRNGMMRSPLYITEYHLFFEFMGTVSVTYLVALLVTLIFEMPITQLQKIFIPYKLETNVKIKKRK